VTIEGDVFHSFIRGYRAPLLHSFFSTLPVLPGSGVAAPEHGGTTRLRICLCWKGMTEFIAPILFFAAWGGCHIG